MWSKCIAAGVPDDLYWRSTPVEVGAVLGELAERREAEAVAATKRAGLVAAAVYNVHRRKGTPALAPDDFVQEKPKKLSPEQMRRLFDAWAGDINRRHDA